MKKFYNLGPWSSCKVGEIVKTLWKSTILRQTKATQPHMSIEDTVAAVYL